MKKVFKKSVSLLLAISALCILFAFQASAISTTCQECGGSNIDYISLGNVGEPNALYYRHEVYCYDCGHSVYEEDCEQVTANGGYCTIAMYCSCNQPLAGYTNHSMYLSFANSVIHIYSCSTNGCSYAVQGNHTSVTVNGVTYCSECGVFLNN